MSAHIKPSTDGSDSTYRLRATWKIIPASEKISDEQLRGAFQTVPRQLPATVGSLERDSSLLSSSQLFKYNKYNARMRTCKNLLLKGFRRCAVSWQRTFLQMKKGRMVRPFCYPV